MRSGIVLSSGGHDKEFLKLGEELNDMSREEPFEEEFMLFSKGEEKDNYQKVQDILMENNQLK